MHTLIHNLRYEKTNLLKDLFPDRDRNVAITPDDARPQQTQNQLGRQSHL